jgi:Holliday junction DNA helicase RuvA
MIAFVQGVLEEKQPTRVVINVAGVGYEVFIPLSSYDQLPSVGTDCRVLTHDHIREDTHQLFGFMSEDERSAFVMLMGISGIGPKLALSALSGLSVRELKVALIEGDVKRLSSISGVGKRMAERMIVELKDKISAGDALEAIAGAADESPEAMTMRDAVLALVSLGYKQDEARKMVKRALDSGEVSDDVEEIIRKSLAR